MHYCPKCGAKTHEGEQYCVSCGIHLPEDIKTDLMKKKSPKGLIMVACANIYFNFHINSSHCYSFYLEYQQDQAKATYQDGVELALEGQFNNAKDHFEQSLDFKSNYKAAQQNLEFMDIAINIQNH